MKVIDPLMEGKGSWQGGQSGHNPQAVSVRGRGQLLGFLRQRDGISAGRGERLPQSPPDSEELGFVVSGSGVVQDMDQNVQARLRQGQLALIERGEIHRLFNDGREPLVVLMVCTANVTLPEG